MSAEAVQLAFAVPRDAAQVHVAPDKEVVEAARQLLAGGDVEFKLSTRKRADSLPRARRTVYGLLRLLPARLFVPPALAMQRGCFDYWRWAVGECEGADDQILVMPRNRTYTAERWDVAVECRPLDPTDAARFAALDLVFGDYAPRLPPGLSDALAELEGVARLAKNA